MVTICTTVACGGNSTKSHVTDGQSPDMCILLMWYDLWILFTNHVIICHLIIIINIIKQKVLIMILFIKKPTVGLKEPSKKFYKKAKCCYS